MERPNIKDYGVSVYIPFSKQRKRYNAEYEAYDLSKLAVSEQKIYKVRKNQLANVNFVSWLLITLITTLWGFYYNISFEQEHMSFLSMGLHTTDPSWIEKGTLFVVPAGAGITLHNSPKLLPSKRLKIIGHIVIKIIPIVILTLLWYIIHTEKQIYQIKKEAKIENTILTSNVKELNLG